MSKPNKPKYKTTNWFSYNAALKARGNLMVWFDPQMGWHAPATGKRGRQPKYSDAAIQCCLTFKCLFGLALRQAIGLVESLLRLMGLSWQVPDYSTVSRRQKQLQVRIPFKRSTGALNMLVDSTGIKMVGEGEWKVKKHGAQYRRQWRKLHLGIDANTLEIRAIEVTDNRTGDAAMLPSLLGQIPSDEPLGSVAADGAYDTKNCHAVIAARDAQAIIPPRKNAQFWKSHTPGNRARNEALKGVRRLGRTIWKQWSGYHQRSLVETKMHCFKRLTDNVMARDFDRQVAELQICAAILNRFTRLGTPKTARVP
jgi:hypothetical protein